MISLLGSGLNDLGSSSRWGHCVVLFANTVLSQCLSSSRCINGYSKFNAGSNPVMV